MTKENILQYIKNSITPQKSNPYNRKLDLELLKIIAAFLVVFYHFAYYNLDYGFTEGVLYLPNITRCIMCIASCSVPLFFMVNGTLMFSKKRSWQSVYLKAVKIAVLTAVWSVIGFPSWFFKTLIILYLLFPFFQYVREKSGFLYRLICIGVLIMPFTYNFLLMCIKACRIESIAGIKMDTLPVTGCFTLYSILYFLLGPVLARREKYPAWVSLILMCTGLGLVVLECTVYTNLNQAVYDGVNAAFPTLGALLLTIGIYMLSTCLKLEPLRKPLISAGGGAF